MFGRVICVVFIFVLPALAGRTGGGGVSHASHGHQSHTYPSSTGLSGTRNNHVLSGSGNNHVYQNTHSSYHKTEVHHHYNAPAQVTYGSHSYPVFHGAPPTYVTVYRDSGSRYDTLLAGLALYNLGKMSSYHSHRDEYRPRTGEYCRLRIESSNGNIEETRIDCRLMSTFIWEGESATQTEQHTVETKVVTNTTSENGTVTTTTVKEAMQVKGPSLQVSPGMRCSIERVGRDGSRLRRHVDCGLLQEYARTSFSKASAPAPAALAGLLALAACCMLRR